MAFSFSTFLPRAESWLRQPTTIAGAAVLAGAVSSVLLHQSIMAEAIPVAIGDLVAIMIPEHPRMQTAAVSVTSDIIAGVAGHQSAATIGERVAADALAALPAQTAATTVLASVTSADPAVVQQAAELAAAAAPVAEPVAAAVPSLAKDEAAIASMASIAAKLEG